MVFPHLGDFIRRLAKIARCARCGGCDFRRLPRSAYKIADVWHVRYRRLNSRAFAKCARSHDFLPFPLRVASKINQSSWAILSHDSSKWRACELFFKSDTTLRFHLVRPKDALEPSKQDGVVYKIPCECD